MKFSALRFGLMLVALCINASAMAPSEAIGDWEGGPFKPVELGEFTTLMRLKGDGTCSVEYRFKIPESKDYVKKTGGKYEIKDDTVVLHLRDSSEPFVFKFMNKNLIAVSDGSGAVYRHKNSK